MLNTQQRLLKSRYKEQSKRMIDDDFNYWLHFKINNKQKIKTCFYFYGINGVYREILNNKNQAYKIALQNFVNQVKHRHDFLQDCAINELMHQVTYKPRYGLKDNEVYEIGLYNNIIAINQVSNKTGGRITTNYFNLYNFLVENLY